VADGGAHEADLALAAFADGDAEAGVALVAVEHVYLGRGCEAAFDHNALTKLGDGFTVGPAAHDYLVLLIDLVAGVGEAEGEVAVVGEEEQAGGVGVEPADGVEA
jgi:hypothetical protein